ncbi:MAG: MaoC family dehydratase [Hyphomicrobiaceae bacterium]|nr:MaoC family dehydratase [Hyphomicrobiaceae bacterium]
MSTYFEDLEIGAVFELGSHTFGREEIIDFARKYDPQPFHLDEDAARQSLFGALCASGWHTGAVWLRHLMDFRKREADLMLFRGERPARYGPSPGFEKLRWLKPVLVGDTLTFTSRISGKIDSRSRPVLGLVLFENEAVNQNNEVVFSVVSKVFVERRIAYEA